MKRTRDIEDTKSFLRPGNPEYMAPPRILVVIPESTRKRPGGDPSARSVDAVSDGLPEASRRRLRALREEIRTKTAPRVRPGGVLPAYRRFDGNMYRHIEAQDWEGRSPDVDVLIVSGLLGIVASRDTIPSYEHSMAESIPPFGKLNRWWHDQGLAEILRAFIEAARPEAVVDLLSLEYREAVAGFGTGLGGVAVKKIDFPGLGRASQPRRGETVARILRTGKP